ncbi:MAG: hypothetical protein PHQ74_04555 [Crocinitomicaceae bacterium]|nr:hypothetical protein [Crocinitomicaceae bacterium]
MALKLTFFTLCQIIPLVIWFFNHNKKNEKKLDLRMAIGYFLFGSWFGMFGELFLYNMIDLIFKSPIWIYKTLPIHNGITSSYGPIMWGLAAVYIYFFHNSPINKKRNLFLVFIIEAGYLLVLELLFNFLAYFLFDDYFFYYFVPDLWHWSSFTNLPFWWIGYKIIVKHSTVMYKQEKLNLVIAVAMIVVALRF